MFTDVATTGLQDLLPDIRARRREIEQARRLPPDLADALQDTRVFAALVPRDLGGDQRTPMEVMQLIEAVAAADGSAGWCTMIGITNNAVAGSLPESGARAVFANPTRAMAGIAAPAGAAVPADGGYRVSGRWAFASGITHSDWAWAGCLVMKDGQPNMTPHGPEIIHVCMPVSDLQIHDTWHVSGLCGTGSNDFSASDVFVPADRTFLLLDTSRNRPEPQYRMPPFATFVVNLACVSLGIARGALDELGELAQTKTPSMHTVVLADTAAAQIELAKAEAALRSARAFLHEVMELMWDDANAGRPSSDHTRALARMAAIHAVETGAAVAHTANRLGGGSTIYSSSTLQRHARDAEAVTHHFTVAPQTWEQAGRVLLGRQPTVMAF